MAAGSKRGTAYGTVIAGLALFSAPASAYFPCGPNPPPGASQSATQGSDHAAQTSQANLLHKKKMAAKPALDAAAVVVLGATPPPAALDNWVYQLGRPGSPYQADYWNEQFDYEQAVAFLRACVVESGGDFAATEIVGRAFLQARNRLPTFAERQYWKPRVKSGQTWYAPLVLTEKAKVRRGG